MLFEQIQLFCDEKLIILKKFDIRNEIVDIIRLVFILKILEISFQYVLKDVNICLFKINILNEILMKYEVEKYRLLFQSKLQIVRKFISVKIVSCVEECVLFCKFERVEDEIVNMFVKIFNFSCLKC